MIFINTHPIQYFSPLYTYLAKQKDLRLKVWYCSTRGLVEYHDNEFQANIQWNVPLLLGFDHTFYRNHSPLRKISEGFFSVLNIKLLIDLVREPKNIVIVHGWGNMTHLAAIVLSKLKGHTVCIRGESNFSHEMRLPTFVSIVKRFCFKLLFSFVDKFLYIGNENLFFYKSLGIKNEKLLFVPYCVDNFRFQKEKLTLKTDELRRELGYPLDARIIVCCGKFISKKNPLDVIKSFHHADIDNSYLIMIGEGELRSSMETLIDSYNIKDRVFLTGFVNQLEISRFYSLADLYVMASGVGETWGLSTNEAMNFALPLLLSDLTGCSSDLVIAGKNGFIFETGNISLMSRYIKNILELPEYDRLELGRQSLEHVTNHYSFESVYNTLRVI
jgi:glycosyltransferase involved in cell wall biosynthesis